MFAANGLHFFDFIGAGFVIPALEGANREDHVDFVRTVFERKRRFGRLYLNEGLRSRETSADTSHANAVGLEVLAHRTREIRVNTDGGERRKVGMLVAPTVDTLRKPHHILVRIRNGQRGQLNSGEQSAENFRRVVLFAVIGHELTHRLRHLFVVELEIVLCKSLFVNAHFVVVPVFTATMVLFSHIFCGLCRHCCAAVGLYIMCSWCALRGKWVIPCGVCPW